MFCSGFISSSIHNHMYPHVFPPHWIKWFWYNFFHSLLFFGIDKNLGLGGTSCLEKVGGGPYRGENIF